MNEDVVQMIDTLRARLADLEAVVSQCSIGLEGYGSKLDGIDTEVYLLQCEVESINERVASGEDVVLGGDDSQESKSVIPDAVKEGMSDAVQMAGDLARDAKPIVSEITGTVSELKEAFGFSGRGNKTPFRK